MTTIVAKTWDNKTFILREGLSQQEVNEITKLLEDIDDLIAHSIKSQMVIENTNDF